MAFHQPYNYAHECEKRYDTLSAVYLRFSYLNDDILVGHAQLAAILDNARKYAFDLLVEGVICRRKKNRTRTFEVILTKFEETLAEFDSLIILYALSH